MEAYASQLLEYKCDLKGREKLIKAAHMYVTQWFEKRKPEPVTANPGSMTSLPSVQVFQELVVSYLSSLHQNYWLFNPAQQLLYTSWTEVRGGRVERLDLNSILVHSCVEMKVGVIKSTLKQKRAEIGWLQFFISEKERELSITVKVWRTQICLEIALPL